MSCAEEHCITCGDQGIPMRVARVSDPGEATCLDPDEQEHTEATDLVGPVTPGDAVLVHAGVAIGRI